MSVAETLLVFVVPPLAVYVLLALLVVAPHRRRRPRYRLGQPWPYEPLFWTADPRKAHLPEPGEVPAGAVRGGARGDW